VGQRFDGLEDALRIHDKARISINGNSQGNTNG
jgi:hypothetical protein